MRSGRESARVWFVLAAAWAALVPRSLAAQGTPPASGVPQTAPALAPATPGQRIVGIRLVGNQTVSPDTILYYLGVKVGDPYDPELIRKNFLTLWNVGLLDNLKIEAEPGPEGVTLIVTVEERPVVTAVEYTGNKKVGTSQIRDALKDASIKITVGAPLSLKEIAKARAAIYDLYQTSGYRSATVDFRVEDISKTEKKVVFVIDEGEKVKIASIRFTGNHVFSAAHLRFVMKKTKVATLWRVLSDKTVYSQANYEADIENIKSLYQDHGYKDVVVKDPILDVYVVNPREKRPAKIKRKVRITIPIVEGERYYFGKVDVTGASVFAQKELLHSFRQCKEGAILNRSLLVEGLADVEKKYREKGYIFIYLDPEYHDAANRRVNVDIKVTEGDKFYLGRVEITGNTSTREKVIRRELTLDEGQVMDMEAFKKSLLKIQQLGYFKVSEEPDFKVRAEEKKVDVTIKGQEASRNEIQFGAGYSALDGFFAQFSFATRNFLGRGEILSLGFQRGSVSNFYNLSYTIPWFLDRNQTVGFSIFNNDLTYIDIDERRKGASLIYGRAIGIFDSWSVAYTYEDVHSGYPVQGAPIPPGQPVPPAAISRFDGTTSSFTPGYRYDSRNDPFDPTEGSAFSSALQVAGGPLGGTSYFLKPTIGGTTYIPFLRHKYFALHGELGYIATFGGRQLPPFERFLIGDPSVRGFGIGRIVPLHDNNTVFVDSQGRLLGGTKYFIGNVEYIFAQAGPVKLLAFLDVAENWAEGQRLGFSKVRSSTGLELRLTLPIFQAPLRFIYSINLHPIQPLDQFGFPISTLHERRSGFDFSIGSSF